MDCLRFALTKDSDRIRDASLSRLGGLRALDREHVPSLLAVGQSLEESTCGGIPPECGRKVGGHRYLTRFGVEFEIDIHDIAPSDAGPLAYLRAYAHHELSAHGGDAAPVRVPVEGHADLRPFAGGKALHELRRDLDARGRLAGLQDLGAEHHLRHRWRGPPRHLC